MAIFPTPQVLGIRHVHVGFHDLITNEQVPDLGMELALWLEAMHLATNGHDDIGYSDFIHVLSKTPPNWAIRSRVAAEDCYQPAICTSLGGLTDYGKGVAHKAFILLQQVRAYDFELTDPSKWTKIDEMIITASFSRRAASLLSVLDRAIKEAISNHESGADEIFNRTNQNPIEAKANIRVMHTTEYREHFKKHEAEDFDAEIVQHDCFVPTAKFGPRAKYDMNILVKFGLIDVRFIRQVGRGRPKRAVKVSDLGTRFLKDLEDRQLL